VELFEHIQIIPLAKLRVKLSFKKIGPKGKIRNTPLSATTA